KLDLAEPLQVLASPEPSFWCSNGGAERGHPARALPFTLEVVVPELAGRPVRLHIVGVMARFAPIGVEAPGTLGGTVQLLGERDIVFRQDLIHGRHYGDARLGPEQRQNGDGTGLVSVGRVEIEGQPYRVDRLTIDLPPLKDVSRLIFRDLGSPASFAIL